MNLPDEPRNEWDGSVLPSRHQQTYIHLPLQSSNPIYQNNQKKWAPTIKHHTWHAAMKSRVDSVYGNMEVFTHPSEANSIEFLVAFSWISMAFDHNLVRTRKQYSSRIGIGTTLTFVSKDIRFFGLFSSDSVSIFFLFGKSSSWERSNLSVSSNLHVLSWGCIHSFATDCRLRGETACSDAAATAAAFGELIPITV